MKKHLFDVQDTTILVSSAGTKAFPESPYGTTVETLLELGVDPRKHKQTKLTKDVALAHDVIVCMAKHHKDFVERFGAKAYLFNELAYDLVTDVADDTETHEIGVSMTLDQFIVNTVKHIHEGIPRLHAKVKQLK